MNSGLSPNQLKAANYLAAGFNNLETAEKCGVSESSIVRWKRDAAFQKAIEDFQARAAAERFEQLLPNDTEDIEKEKQVESEQLDRLDEIIKKLSSLIIELIDNAEPEDISPRALPGLTKALTGALECRRAGSDRITGIDLILDELGKAEEIFSEKVPVTSDSTAA